MSSMHTACVVGKNYRLQDIQLSKILRGSAPNHVARTARCEASDHFYNVGRGKQGGEYRARTGDLLDANQALSQLS